MAGSDAGGADGRGAGGASGAGAGAGAGAGPVSRGAGTRAEAVGPVR